MKTPHVRELRPAPDPFDAAERLTALPHPLLLESRPGFGRLGRYSFLCADPFLVIRAKNGIIEETDATGTSRREGDPFETLRRRLAELATEPADGLPPFQGGAAGYLAYDLCQHLERLPRPRYDDLDLPDLDVGLYDWVIAWDHGDGSAWLISTGLPESRPERRERRAAERAAAVLELLSREDAGASADRAALDSRPPAKSTAGAPKASGGTGTNGTGDGPPEHAVPGVPGVVSTFTPSAYVEAVERGIEYIRAGDIFQVNLSQRLVAPWGSGPIELYRRLRRVNPAPFSAFYDTGRSAVISASPERFLKVTGSRVETRPIKGTRPRGQTPRHDMALEDWLRASEKDRAENVMIVDLLRNDLSRVCRDGSVRVPELCVIERFATVHHLVSTVEGELRPNMGAIDLLRAAFPGGSVTGAPKIRAMEIIAELEPTQRNVYCGAIGYIGFDGSMDTNIPIRTFILKPGTGTSDGVRAQAGVGKPGGVGAPGVRAPGGRVYFQAGGAVVSDSDPEAEYRETLDKAEGMLAALRAGAGVA